MQDSNFPEFIDRYKIEDRLGKGGQGVVYLAHDPNLDIKVAVKVLASDNPDFVERFKLDARVLARLNAPNIVRIFDFNPNYPYLVMEFCPGGDLNDQIKSRRPQTLKRIVELVRQICEALIVAHEQPQPILHRDLKPGNVLFDKRVAKVTDFGLAKVLNDQTSGMTMSQGMMGTAGYASPEQLQDASKVDHRTDLWAVGVILYELMTFRGPFEKTDDDNVFQTAMRVIQDPPGKPAYAMPRPIWEVIERALKKPRAERFASAREMAQALDAALASVPEADRNASYPPDQGLAEIDRLALRLADSVESEQLDSAHECLQSMKQISRDASVTRYWARRLRDRGGSDRPVSSSSTSPTAPGSDSSSSLASIDKLTSEYRFADGRRECGKLLIADPNNSAVHDRLLRISTDERELNAAIEQARSEAGEARSGKNLERVVQLWAALEQRYPGHSDISAELAGATGERDGQQRGERSEKASAAATSQEQAGDLTGALATLDEYLQSYPDDDRLARERERLRAAHTAQTRDQRVQKLRDKARKSSAQDPETALAAWRAILDELPTDEEAHRETERIRQAATALELARGIRDAESQAEPLLARHEYSSAIVVWHNLQEQYPGDAGIRDRIATLEKQEQAFRKRSLVETIGQQADRLAAANDSGRYEACKGVPERLAKIVRDARVALRGDVAALTVAGEQIGESRATAEAELIARLQSLRIELLKRLNEATELVPGEAATEHEKSLKVSVAGVTRTLCESDLMEENGNPLLALDATRTMIEAAIQGVVDERGAETEKAQRRSEAAIKAAERAMEQLAVSSAASSEGGRKLAEQMESLLERSGSRSADVLEQVVIAATELAHQAISTRVRSEWDRLQKIRQALAEAADLIAAGAAGQLDQCSRACLKLTTAKSASVSVEQQDRTLTALTLEIEQQRKLLDEVQSGAAGVWQKAIQRSKGLGDAVSETLRSRIKQSLHAGESLAGKELDREARRLTALVSCAQVESAWVAQAGTFRGMEEGTGVAEISADLHGLVTEYREAAARGDSSRMSELGARIAEGSGSDGVDPVEVPHVGGRMRRFNLRLLPEGLEAYDDHLAAFEQASSKRNADPSEAAFVALRSYRALLQPPPAWHRWSAVTVLVLMVASATLFALPRSEPATVRLVSPSGPVQVELLNSGASTLATLDVGPDGISWNAPAGEYTVKTEHDVIVHFNIPLDETILVPGAPASHGTELANRLGLRELLGSDE